MGTAGIVRKLDRAGRIVLPMPLRRKFGIGEEDGLEIFTDEDCIVLRKYNPRCVHCGKTTGVADFRGEKTCRDCAERRT